MGNTIQADFPISEKRLDEAVLRAVRAWWDKGSTVGLSVAQTTFYVEQDLDRAWGFKPIMEALERLVVAGSLRKCIGILPAVSLTDRARKGRVALDRYLPNS